MADDVDDFMAGGGLHHLIHRARYCHRHTVGIVDGLDVLYACDGGEFGRCDRRCKLEVDAAASLGFEVLDRFDGYEPTVAHDGDAVGDSFDLRKDVRLQEDRSTLGLHLIDHVVELLLHERVEPGARLIENE